MFPRTLWCPVGASALALIVVSMVAGCSSRAPKAARRPTQGRSAQQATTALFDSIKTQLRTLPESTTLNLAPPTVVLDARSSANGEEIQGLLTKRPGASNQPANLIQLTSRNARFREFVRPGDILKYFGRFDRETEERRRETGEVDIVTFDAIEMVVAQVLREDQLLIVGGAPAADFAPRKIEVWRISDQRMQEIQRQWSTYVARREPALGWQPTPDEAAVKQLTEQLNEWLRQSRLAGKRADVSSWKRPALLSTLPEELAASEQLKPLLSDKELSTGYFPVHESRQLQGTTWARDIARWARGSDSSPLSVAESLFDWTTRNLQLIDNGASPPRWTWELLLQGQATAQGRAKVFVELCRQRNLDTAVIEVEIGKGSVPYPLVGVLVESSLHLFDPALGLAIRNAEGQVASLAETQTDDSLLRAYDLPEAPYPLTAELVSTSSVYAIATPLGITRRATAFAMQLTADDAMVLSSDIDATAERIVAAEGVDSVAVWPAPFQTLLDKLKAVPSQRRQAVKDFLPYAWRPPLWRGRLHHFRGVLEDEDQKRETLDEALNDHRAARQFYMDRSVRPADDRLARVPEEKRVIYQSSKTLATLFLANLSYDQGAYGTSRKWLENEALQSKSADAYRATVTYNLARAYEALGELERAIGLLSKIEGPMASGAKLRAKALRAQAEASSSAAMQSTDVLAGTQEVP